MFEYKCLCNSTELKVKRSFGKRKLFFCNNCGSLSILPFPSTDVSSIVDFYQKDDYLENIDEREYFGYYKVIENEINKLELNKNAKILDFGCGYGFVIRFLKLNGFLNSFGYEINNNLIASAKKKFNHDFLSSDYSLVKSKKYDLIIINMVIEHLINPIEVLNENIYNLLSENGVVIFTIPNMNSLNRLLLGNKWMGYSPNEHIYFLNPQKLDVLVNFKKYKLVSSKVKSSINTKYDAWKPKGFVKYIVKNTVMRFSELIGRGDQLLVTIKKAK